MTYSVSFLNIRFCPIKKEQSGLEPLANAESVVPRPGSDAADLEKHPPHVSYIVIMFIWGL